MKITKLFFLFLIFYSTRLLGQSDTTFYVDYLAYESIKDKSVQHNLEKSLKGFLLAKNGGSRNNPYIDPAYLNVDSEPFIWFLNMEQKLPNGENFYKPTLLTALPIGEQEYIIKLAYMGISKHTPPIPFLRMIVTLIAKKSGDRYFFYNSINHNTKEWNSKQVGTIKYLYPGNFNLKNARKMNEFNSGFAKKFGVKEIQVTYYKCENLEQLFKMMGYDYIENMYYAETGGLAQSWNNTIFAGNNSEKYEHELIHFYMSRLFPNIGKIVNEGYATYLGGSGGKTLSELVPLAKTYIINNPNGNLADIGTDFTIRVEGGTLITYILSAVICSDIENRFGLAGLKRFFSPNNNEDYFSILQKVSGVDRAGYSNYIKELLDRY